MDRKYEWCVAGAFLLVSMVSFRIFVSNLEQYVRTALCPIPAYLAFLIDYSTLITASLWGLGVACLILGFKWRYILKLPKDLKRALKLHFTSGFMEDTGCALLDASFQFP